MPENAEAPPAAAGLLPPDAAEAWPEFGAFGAAESVLPELADSAAEPVVPALLPAVAPGLPGAAPDFSAAGAVEPGFAEPLVVGAELPAAEMGRVEAAGAGLSAPATGLRSVVASGRASAAAGVAGSALSRAGFLSSFGSDTHYPSLRRNS
ncbi:hypothetical protein [Nocardia sp. NPDC050175]|uniref:hypothetical protein n=1 Tax=Nocardia sp. NPDC050175 TaxID=3364317 RepID=UPI00378C4363